MYTRVPDRKPQAQRNISIPDNYSGNAFNIQKLYNEFTDESYSQPQASSIEMNAAPPPLVEMPTEHIEIQSAKESTEKPTEKAIYSNAEKSEVSSLLPFASTKLLKNHFPFGHGIGSEELLILGIMTLLFSNDEANSSDGELIMLLALLLFAG